MKNLRPVLSLLLLLGSFSLIAQNQMSRPPADQIKQTIMPKPGYDIGPAVFINPMDLLGKENWDITLTQRGGVYHSDAAQTEMEKIIAEKTAAKKVLIENQEEVPELEKSTVVATTPVVLTTFEANDYNNIFPPDNNMAISDDGYIVSVINSAVSYHDADGNTLMPNMNFSNFLSGLSLNNFLFDPKVLYDPIEDKFIMIILSGSSPTTSTVVVGFSVSQNPADGWNFYTYTGDLLDGNWFDYPNIGISEHDLFISGNLFTEDDNFAQTVVLQIKKENGFTGGTMDWEYFNGVLNANGGNAFTVVPAGYGYDGGYGPGIFMVSNFSFGGNQIFLYEVTDSVNANQQINVFSVNVPFYDSPGGALQGGTSDVLSTGGNRIRNAFYNNGLVHLVYATDFQGGFSGVRYHRLNTADLTAQTKTFGQSQQDLAYPSVVPFGMSDTTQEVMICYLRSTPNTFPGIGAVNCDNDMEFSDPIIVKAGESIINASGTENERWGDYSGGARRHTSPYPNAWFVGCFGKNTDYGNWIFELSDDGANSGVPPIANFEGAPRDGEAAHTVYFNDLSTNGATTHSWIFEGGTPATSSAQNQVVNYPNPGKYDVTLIVENQNGADTIYRDDYVDVIITPIANYSATPTSGVAPLTVTFTNLSVNATTFQWGFSGGEPNMSTEENPTIVYNNPGSFHVNLIASNDWSDASNVNFNYIIVEENVATSESEKDDAITVFPNPISGTFTVDFYNDKKMEMDIYLLNAAGQRVKTLLQNRVKAGRNILSFNRDALPAGTYFLIIKDEQEKVVRNETVVVGG